MKIKYKGYEIEVSREECLGGWCQVDYSVFRISDGLEVISDFSESEDSDEIVVNDLKERVDCFISTRGESEEMELLY